MVEAPRALALPFCAAGLLASVAAASFDAVSVDAGLAPKRLPAAAGVDVVAVVAAGAVVVVAGWEVAVVVAAPPKRLGLGAEVSAGFEKRLLAVAVDAGAVVEVDAAVLAAPKRPPLAGADVAGVAGLAPKSELPLEAPPA